MTQSPGLPDLLLAAVRRTNADHAIVIGDSIWDVLAAQACGFACIGLRSGGISAESLVHTGAAWVYDGPRHLLASLEGSPLAR